MRFGHGLLLALFLTGCADDAPSPFEGTWRDLGDGLGDEGFTSEYTFAADGALAIRVERPPLPDTTFHATYALDYDSVLTVADQSGSEQFIAHVREDTLTLRTSEGDRQRYVRTRP